MSFLSDICKHHSMDYYIHADDQQLYSSFEVLSPTLHLEYISRMNDCFCDIIQWLPVNMLMINAEKHRSYVCMDSTTPWNNNFVLSRYNPCQMSEESWFSDGHKSERLCLCKRYMSQIVHYHEKHHRSTKVS